MVMRVAAATEMASVDREKRRAIGRQVKDRQSKDGADKEQRRVAELIEGTARDHAANFSDGFIRTNAASRFCGTKPEIAACLLDGMGESAVIDDLAADRFDAARCSESCGTNKHAASSGSGCGAPAIANPCWRVEHEEEENECGDQPALEP